LFITLILWAIYFFVFFLYGLAGFWLFGFKTRLKESKLEISHILLFGLVVVTAFGLILNFIIPMRLIAFSIMVAGAIILFIYFFRQGQLRLFIKKPIWNKKNWLKISISILVFIFVLYNTVQLSKNPDSGQYHTQAIRWTESYPVVPGLGNLHDRLAYNSSWFVLLALFSFSFFPGISFHVMPGFVFLLFSIGMLSQIQPRRFHITDIFPILFLPLLLFTNASELSSPGTDLPVILAVSYCVFLFSFKSLLGETEPWASILMAGLLLWTITIKLSAIPVLLLIFVLLVESKNRVRFIKSVLGFSFLLIFPWMIRNLILSGYPLFPSPMLNVFNFDWKIPLTQVQAEQISIRGWARFPRMDPNEILSLPLLSWVKIWLSNLTLNRKILILSSLVIPIIHFGTILINRKYREISKQNGSRFTIVFLFAGFVFWFFSAPNIRFGFAFILPQIAIGISAFLIWFMDLLEEKWKQVLLNTVSLGSFVLVSVLFIRSLDFYKIQTTILFPTAYPTLPTEPCHLGNATIFCASSYNECWYSPFPCIPSAIENVYLRGDNYAQGFYYKND